MKPAFLILQLLLLTLGAYLFAGMVYQPLIRPSDADITGRQIRALPLADTDETAALPDRQKKYRIITDKNLFQVLTHPPDSDRNASAPGSTKEPLEKTRLQLALWGTVTAASKNASFAVIENKKTGEQSLFQVGDQIEGATIREIGRNQVILRVNGKDQLLEVDFTRKPAALVSSPPTLPEPETGLTEQEPATVPGLPSLMKQARIRPFFSNGKPDGLLLYGIRNDSIFQQIGLRNGDIIKAINDSDILSAQDAVTIYQSLNTPLEEMPDIRFTIQRRGKLQEIVYNAQNNEYTVENASDE
ncbi:MAG: type II secretion system protein N [Desulfotignum sp.]|nr:type II secretion system protein N [Desulfotignum sp.]